MREYPKVPNFIQFIISKSEESGYFAKAINYSIYTQGETLDETVQNISEAVECYFGDDSIESPYKIPILVNFEV
jgi:predicted RNase H-like HicB family nuclease